MGILRISDELRARIERWAREGYPLETCGLMLGRLDNGLVKVEEVTCARNLNAERAHDRYDLDPQDFLDADGAARGRGWDIVGIWHSHPDHPARPSKTDREAAWRGWSYLILSVNRERVEELRSWHLEQEEFEEEAIVP